MVEREDNWTVDPITKKEIEEPVRNMKCKHIYEKATIYNMMEQAMENKKPVRCPYIGCSEKDFNKADLVREEKMEKTSPVKEREMVVVDLDQRIVKQEFSCI